MEWGRKSGNKHTDIKQDQVTSGKPKSLYTPICVNYKHKSTYIYRKLLFEKALITTQNFPHKSLSNKEQRKTRCSRQQNKSHPDKTETWNPNTITEEKQVGMHPSSLKFSLPITVYFSHAKLKHSLFLCTKQASYWKFVLKGLFFHIAGILKNTFAWCCSVVTISSVQNYTLNFFCNKLNRMSFYGDEQLTTRRRQNWQHVPDELWRKSIETYAAYKLDLTVSARNKLKKSWVVGCKFYQKCKDLLKSIPKSTKPQLVLIMALLIVFLGLDIYVFVNPSYQNT